MSEALKAAQARRAELQAAGEIERLDPIEKARRNPNSKVLAIRAKCWECVGCTDGARATIRGCTSVTCPLHQHRPYQRTDDQEDS